MNQLQKIALFKSALLEMKLKTFINSEKDLVKFRIQDIPKWSSEKVYGEVNSRSGKLTYLMFGAPYTNSKVIDLISNILELEIENIEFGSDEPKNASDYVGFF